MIDFYSSQSTFTDPGELGAWIDGVPGDLEGVRRAAAQLVFHYWAHGDITEHGFAPERRAEINLRYADVMLRRARELNSAPPPADRVPTEQLVGCCRDNTVLFLTLARHHGIPARGRVGFAGYLVPGLFIDHMIPEVWDAVEGRWRLVEPEFPDGYTPPGEDTPLDLTDVPRDRFLAGSEAWELCRAGKIDPERVSVGPGFDLPFLKSWPYLVHNLVFDLAALNKVEMLLWDGWGMIDTTDAPDEATFERMDRLAALVNDPAVTLDRIQAAYDDPDLRVPPVVSSYPPPDNQRIQVRLR
ncbi:transglutaminase domain-containing protein [Actinomadura rudentiformis]|uniref:Transglutaminase domain-containing protein n=1 Tax=Actinomadura rudentiformis TaxID=359158 RepID=A0A6H9YS77_9ACTN|nr:transglutaminase domain-containing protein [Actinomadura rudentiformis]KAB2348303.1 transglutaminase domain-containing protein [Actinomadura rudentiformis]